MIDFHTHILPGVDDGSSDARESTEMLQEEMRQGVRLIVATPHFYANRISVEGFLRQRELSIQTWDEYLSKCGDIFISEDFEGIYAGAEVYYFPGMGRAERLRDLTIRGTNTILVEMPFVQWTEEILQEIRRIIEEQKLNVVLAHVERYPEFQKHGDIMKQILNLPLVIQLNTGSFLGSRSRRKYCLNLLKEKDNVILASDCHNMDTRRPNMKEAEAMIRSKFGEDRLARIEEISRALIGAQAEE